MDSADTPALQPPTALATQWRNPTDILSLLLLIGGDIVQKAIAQQFGVAVRPSKHFRIYLTPVAFSFGWVGYAFTSLASIAGDHQLMPVSEDHSIVINCDTGYARVNRSWILARVLRDHKISTDKGKVERQDGLRVSFRIDSFTLGPGQSSIKIDGVWRLGWAIIFAQLIIAAVPWILYDDWAIFLITAAGTLFALLTGSLRQWKDEKWPARTLNSTGISPEVVLNGQFNKKPSIVPSGSSADSGDVDVEMGHIPAPALDATASSTSSTTAQHLQKDSDAPKAKTRPKLKSKVVCLSQGNGHSIALLLEGTGTAWDLEKFATATFPTQPETPWALFALSIAWVCLLLSVSGLKQHTWFLVGVGLLGMLQNIYAAAASRSPASLGLAMEPLAKRPTIIATNAPERTDEPKYNQYNPALSPDREDQDPEYWRRLLREDLGPTETIGVRGAIQEAEKLFPGAGFAMMPIRFPALTRRVEGERYRHLRERRFWEWMRDHPKASDRRPPGKDSGAQSEGG